MGDSTFIPNPSPQVLASHKNLRRLVIKRDIKALEARLEDVDALIMKKDDQIRHKKNYDDTKEVFAEFKRLGYPKEFGEAHKKELDLRKAAKKYFDSNPREDLPPRRELEDEQNALKQALKDRRRMERHKHRTANGEFVLSKSEALVADALFSAGISYEYEKPIQFENEWPRYPDFTIRNARTGVTYYWEHCGMMNDEGYVNDLKKKLAIYERNGIVEGKNLIITYDDAEGGIDSQVVRGLINQYLV